MSRNDLSGFRFGSFRIPAFQPQCIARKTADSGGWRSLVEVAVHPAEGRVGISCRPLETPRIQVMGLRSRELKSRAQAASVASQAGLSHVSADLRFEHVPALKLGLELRILKPCHEGIRLREPRVSANPVCRRELW
jgi:hypothetical protein